MAQIKRRGARALRFGAHLGRGVRRLAVDSTLRGRRAFPRTVGDLTPENLSEITGRTVTSATVLDGASGTSSRARLALTGADVPGVGVRQDVGRQCGHPDARRAGRPRGDRGELLPAPGPRARRQRGAAVVRGGLRSAHRPLRGGSGGHDHLAVPVSGHAAPVGQGPDGAADRMLRAPARHLLGSASRPATRKAEAAVGDSGG